ncbi:hypothetical protein VNI00_017905 [Paramarasmius palmivorus]|uniref:Uncharacterized protein n=1 Tax=Paramarasmius palmivorus TaxID=297713 RepID=A0AAW0B399_9AGAR
MQSSELRVDVRNTRPKFTPSKAGALVKDGESRRRGVDVKGKAPVIAGESSELDSKGGLLPSEDGFPAKVRVKDLSAPAVAGDRNSAGTELKAVRSRRLSSKARHAREGISLLDKFTDESYHGESRRAVRKSGRSKPSRSLDVTGQNDVPGDSRVGAAANQTDGFNSLTDTEDELPSPSTIFSATATRASSGTLSSRGNGSPCQVTDNSDKCGDVRGEISLGRLPGTDNVSNRRSDDVDGVSGVVTKESSLPISLGDSAEPVKQPSRVFSDAIPFVDDEASVSEDDGSDCKESSVSPLLDADCIHPDLKSLYVTMDWINSLRRSCFIGYPNTEKSERDKDSDSLAAAPYSSISKSVSMRSQKVAESFEPVAAVNVLDRGAPAYRTFEDGIPLYDGRTKPGTKGFQFGSRDWEAYTKLPSYPFPEVEDNSLVTVAFTLTGFRGNNSTHHTVHFNGLFAIILGKVDD